MIERIKDNKIILAIILFVIILASIIYIIIFNNENNYEDIEEKTNEESTNIVQIENKKENKIVVDISGQVNKQGVITLDEGSRIIDAVNLAEGLTDKADLNKINLAYILSDAEKIYIPSIEDNIQPEIVSTNNNTKISVNINTAIEQELEKIPGIGSTIAKRIVNYRNENGKYKSIDDLKNVSGIGESKYNKIKEYIYVK